MCGIGGIVRLAGRNVDREALDRMGRRMVSRGPDGQATWVGDGVGLVHRRLKIIDLSDSAACPIANEDGSMLIVFNGEIYNYRAMREELRSLGHRFRSQGDTEAILHGYEQWGVGVLNRLDGMFAFALWDGSRERLIVARDRLGEKPVFVGRFGDATYFGSSPAVIATALGRSPSVDKAALDCFLSLGFIPARHTVFESIEVVAPATVWTISRDGSVERQRYWRLPVDRTVRTSVAEAEAAIEREIDESVRRRLVADVPVGGLLSGGVDSSLVMAIAARHTAGIRSYSVGFEDAQYDERSYAAKVAAHIATKHETIEVGEKDVLAILPRLVWEYGQPFGDASAVPTYLVSARARRDVTVVLTGDGGDEAFGGYWRALSARYAELYRSLVPDAIRAWIVPGALALTRRIGAGAFASRLGRLDTMASAPSELAYTNGQSWYERRSAILGPALRDVAKVHVPSQCFSATGDSPQGHESLVARAMRADYQTQLSDAFLVKVDVASMAAGVEARAPFLAPSLVEAAWRLPDDLKVRRGETKWLLKRIAARYVPPQIVYRRKMGFAMPTPRWFRGELGRVTEELAGTSRAVAAGWIDLGAVRSALREHREGRDNHATRLWLFLWLELWLRVCLEESMSPTETLG